MRGSIAALVIMGLAGCVRQGADVLPDGWTAGAQDQALADHVVGPSPDAPPPGSDGVLPQLDGSPPQPDGPLPQPDGPPPQLDGPLPQPDAPADAPQIPLDALPTKDVGGSVCAPSAVATTVGFKAVLCASTTQSYDQCNAHNLCNKGSTSLCTATQYQNRIKAGVGTSAWIGACIRAGATPGAPKGGICSACVSFAAPSVVVEWLCYPQSIGAKSTYSHLGLVAHTDCRRVGLDQASTEGFWRPSPAGTKLSAAICCY